MSERLAFVVVLLGAILWGTSGTAQTFIPVTVDPFIIATLRLAIGGFVLFFILIIFNKIKFKGWPWKATIGAAIILALFQYSFFTSVRLTGVAIGTVVTIGSAPLFAGILEWVILRKLPPKKWFIATFFSIIGSLLLFLNKELLILNTTGIIVGLGAGFLFASYTFMNKKILENVGAIQMVAVVFSISALILSPFFFAFNKEGLLTTEGILAILYIGIFTASIAYVLFSIGLKKISASSATTLSLAEPLTAALLGVFIVGEDLNMTAWIGISFLLGGILIITLGRKRIKS